MSGYIGQGSPGGYDTTSFDGPAIFTEELRARVAHFKSGNADGGVVKDLYNLAFQSPYPSHQARYLLEELMQLRLICNPDYDNALGMAWRTSGAGCPHLAALALADAGLPHEFIDCTGLSSDA